MNPVTGAEEPLTSLPFPPLYKSHILHCSYHYWHARYNIATPRSLKPLTNACRRYRSITPKARLIPLTQPFLEYLRADGIVLPDEDDQPTWSDDDSGIFSSTDDADGAEEEDADPSAQWREVHDSIRATIAELGGKVVPKLNWSAPKDATWIAATNSMECRTPNDIYLLLKSSDFVTHDLEHALDDCAEDQSADEKSDVYEDIKQIPYQLVLRKFIQLNPSVEFRCFVRRRKLLALCQRDLNHFDFLFRMEDKLRDAIQSFFDDKLRDSFPDENFVFDVYVPPPHKRVWLVDVNPWAQRTDPLLYSWLELLTMPEPPDLSKAEEKVVRIPIRKSGQDSAEPQQAAQIHEESSASSEEEADEELFTPEFRMVKKDDPEAYSFNTPQFSAHKLPRDVVDASQGGAGSLREFAENWKDILAKRQKEEDEESEAD